MVWVEGWVVMKAQVLRRLLWAGKWKVLVAQLLHLEHVTTLPEALGASSIVAQLA